MFRYLLSFFLFSGGGHIDQTGISDYNVKTLKKSKKKKQKQSHQWVEALPKLTTSYNKTYHH